MNKRLLVVGGTGFIGSHVVRKAIKEGYDVTAISKNECDLSKKVKGVEYLKIDIANKKELLNELKNKHYEFVINLGGYVDHSDMSKGGIEIINTHYHGVINLINCLNKSKLKMFIQIGSSDEYGSNEAPQKETQREIPISPYSLAKTLVTHYLQMMYRLEKFPVVILRPFLVYGIGQDENRFIPQLIKGCINKISTPVSLGEQLRDFCYIDDIVEVILLTLNSKKACGEVFNIGSGIPVSIKFVVNKILTLIGSGSADFGAIKYRPFENMSLYADTSKIFKFLGWQAKVDLDKGLIMTIDYFLNSTDGKNPPS